MSASVSIEYEVTLVPVGETIGSTDEDRVESFVDEYDTKYTEYGVMQQELVDRGLIDPYAVRNHWRIARLDPHYESPPWGDSLKQLADDVESFNHVQKAYLDASGVGMVTLSVVTGEELAVSSQLNEYYSVLSPIVDTGQVTFSPHASLVDLRTVY